MRMAARTGMCTGRGVWDVRGARRARLQQSHLLCHCFGRWNTESNETTWKKPQKIVAKKGIAAGYLSKVQKSASSPDALGSSAHEDFGELQRAKSGGGVSGLTRQFSGMKMSAPQRAAAPESPVSPALGEQSPISPSGISPSGKSALSVEALRKYQEAKLHLARTASSESAASTQSARSSRSSRADAPPQVDLYK